MRTGRRELIRDLNRALVLNLVRERRAISRADIARITGLSPSTVTSITASLLADELLVEGGPSTARGGGRDGTGSVGRPASLLRVDPQARHVVGVKLAPESLTATVTDLDAEPMAMVTLPHGPLATLDEIVELLGSAIDDLRTEAGLGHERPLGIGVGLPGGVDPDSGTVVRSPLPGWVGEDLAGTLEERLDLPVLIDNDVNTLTVVEHLYGAGRGIDHLLVVTIGRGIGMGAVIDGSIARGARGALGEIGHVTAVPDGRECWCGLRGCLEAEAAEPAIVRDVLTALDRVVPPEDMAAVAEEDERVAAILRHAGGLVGSAIGSAMTLLDPQRVVVSGEGVRLGRHYIDGIRDGIPTRPLPEAEPDLVFEPWGDEAWARGAASLVLRELFTPAHLRGERHPAGGQSKSRGEPSSTAAR
jgi:predicted NBD/HSP70 family sugar kinase